MNPLPSTLSKALPHAHAQPQRRHVQERRPAHTHYTTQWPLLCLGRDGEGLSAVRRVAGAAPSSRRLCSVCPRWRDSLGLPKGMVRLWSFPSA